MGTSLWTVGRISVRAGSARPQMMRENSMD
jgi:hypothetical protein